MLKRIGIYLMEMYPPLARLFVSLLVFLQVYFLLLLNQGVSGFSFDGRELIGVLTIFTFLLLLRIADDFKDYHTDRKLFPERALPSGRVRRKDLALLASFGILVTAVLNFLYMPNRGWFIILYIYGTLMSVWFFQRHRIQPNLILALVTHNPVQFFLNFYVISFVTAKYGLPMWSWQTILVAFTLYFPVLYWEVSRKIRAPEDETDYTTYSKVMGVAGSVRLVLIAVLLDLVTNVILLWRINLPVAVLLILNAVWLGSRARRFVHKPSSLSFAQTMEGYIYRTETGMVLGILLHLLWLRLGR